jgi:hypothetical protein
VAFSRGSRPGAGTWIAGLALVSAVLVGCASGPPPVFESPKALGETVVMFDAEIQLPQRLLEGPNAREMVETSLTRRLRQALAGKGIGFGDAEQGADAASSLRVELLDAWRAQRRQSSRRLRVGSRVQLPPGAAALRAEGAQSAILPILTGRKGGAEGDDYAPIPPGQVHWKPDERSDYEIPRAGEEGMTSGVDLDLVIVDLANGQIVAHRRVIHPAEDTSGILASLPVMVREATRNLEAM